MGAFAHALIYGVAAAVLVCSAAVAWRHRTTRPVMALSLMVVSIGGAWWSIADGIVVANDGSTTSGVAALAAFPGAAVTVAAFFCLGRCAVGTGWHPTRRTLGWLTVEPVLVTVVALTNPWRLWLYRGPGASRLTTPDAWVHAPLFWVHIGYCYVLLVVACVQVVRGWWLAPEVFRPQRTSLLVGSLIPVVLNLVNLAGVFTGHEDPTPIGFAVTGTVIGFAILRQDLITFSPVARGVLIERIGDAVVALSPDRRIIDLNPAAERLLRATSPAPTGALIGQQASDVMADWCLTDTPGVHVDDALRGRPGDAAQEPYAHLTVDIGGYATDLEVRASPLVDRRGGAIGTVYVARDVTLVNEQRRRLEEQLVTIEHLRGELAEQANRDSLTSLHNRRYLMSRFAPMLELAECAGAPLAVVLVDLDLFKSVNDQHGHLVGDSVLVAMAARLRRVTPPDALVARWGGEEFVLVLPGADTATADGIAEELRRSCADAPLDVDGRTYPCTVSAGVSAYPECGRTVDELLEAADRALYEAKRAGRDRVRMSTGRAVPVVAATL